MSDCSTPTEVFERIDGLILRTAQLSDASMLANYFNSNKAYLEPWEPKREAAFFLETGWAQRLIKLSELHRLGLGYYLVIQDEETKEMLGTISFSNLSRFPFHACNVGYSLAESAQGKGIMRRCLEVAVNYMFEIQNMHRIMAGYMPCNERSAKVLEALGFEKEGYAKDYLLINGQWQDHVLTALVNPNWSAK